jgi:hypothetical protein
LRRLHLVELPDADAEELLGQILRHLFGDAGVLADDAQDEPALTVGAVPAVRGWGCGRTTVAVNRVGSSLGLLRCCMPVAVAMGRRDEAGVLDFLIDGVLQKFVKFLHFGFDLSDVAEFDFNGGAEAVAAVLGQAEFFAVIGAEFDGHDGVCLLIGVDVLGWVKKPPHGPTTKHPVPHVREPGVMK